MHPDTPPPSPKSTPRRKVLLTILAVVLLGALGSGAYYLGQRPPSDGGRYDTPQALVAAMEKRGVTCARYETVESPRAALGRGSCWLDEHETPIAVYATTADAKAEPARMNRLLGGIEVDMVVGLNWTVNCHDEATAGRVAGAIGGEVVHLAKPTS